MVRIQAFFSKHVTRPTPHRLLYQLTGGSIGSRLPSVGPSVLLLTAVGRRSGERRTTPLVYFLVEDELVVVGTNNGEDRHPGWLLNLQSEPEADVQIGRERRRVVARVPEGAERDRLWAEVAAQHPLFAYYQSRTTRQLPLVILGRRGS